MKRSKGAKPRGSESFFVKRMKLADFDYRLPRSLIARYPPPNREDARLLHLPEAGEAIEHLGVADLPRLLRPGDLLVLNETKVNPWRLRGRRKSGGRAEVLLLEQLSPGRFRAMARANRPLKEGETIIFDEAHRAVLGPPGRERELEFSSSRDLPEWLESFGEMPIPPYLGRGAEAIDKERYQTVFARNPGAAAAPTAGLHLSAKMLKEISDAGVRAARLTLHVGAGTFRPVQAENIEEHEMEPEACVLTEEAVSAIHETKAGGGRLLAVGTTVVRALESAHIKAAARGAVLKPGEFSARLFIRPGFRFRMTDMLLTNFHLPRSTLLVLAAAFAGRERLLRAYAEAVREGYRFYSYGDAMLMG